MFTGIVTAIGRVIELRASGNDARLEIQVAAPFLDGCVAGDSISVAGVCLTVVELGPDRFAADVSHETLDCTTTGQLQCGDLVNLEAALRAGDPLGGHLVSGHVDGAGQLVGRESDGRAERFTLQAPRSLMAFIAPKGSICVDGVSLTVNGVGDDTFEVCVIPHTLEVTTLGHLSAGDPVNLEVDVMARYAARWMETRRSGGKQE